jgi:hypothetical protein
MNPPKENAAIVLPEDPEPPAPSLGSVVRKSALLNAVIVLTSFPVLVSAGGPNAVVLTFAIMAGISVLIWTATFALFSFASFPRIFRPRAAHATQRVLFLPADDPGVADRWLDAPA